MPDLDVEIIETSFGVANTYKIDNGFRIELNEHLKDFPELRERVIQHEKEHTLQKTWLKQRKVDALTELKFRDLFPFYKKHPLTFLQQYAPITYSKKENIVYFEWSLIVLYFLGLSVLALIIWLISTFSSNRAFFWLILEYTVIGLVIISIIYFGGKALIKEINKESKELPKGKQDKLSNLKSMVGK